MMKKLALSFLILCQAASASVVLPYTFSPGQTIQSSQVNANLSALMNEINAHEANANGHNTSLQSVLSVNNQVGSTPINFNESQALGIRVENLSADPTPGNPGRLFYNTTTNLLKVDTGATILTVAGSGVNNLSSVLNSGNSAGSSSLDMNENQVLHVRVENLTSDPSPGNTGRMFYNTTQSALKVDTGSAIVAIGGAQGLASVLGVSNSVGSSSINFNGQQAQNLILDTLTSDPGTSTAGRIYYNSVTQTPKFYNGSSWLSVGNTNTLSQTLALGNSAGSNDIDFNSHQAKNMRVHNLVGPPGTGTAGILWYDTANNDLEYEASSANHKVCSLDDAQALTNKSISGASNTLTNIPDSALSANVGLLGSSQTITGTKTFSAAPVLSKIKTPSGTTLGHTIPDGLSDDTFVLANAVQTLSGKILNGPTLSSNQDFAEFQALHIRVENVATTPAAGNQGRIIYKSSTGELLYDNGSTWLVLATSTTFVPTLAQVLAKSNSAGTYNIDLNNNQVLNLRVENVTSLPAAGNAGRIVFNSTDGKFYDDNGSGWSPIGTPTGSVNTLALFNGSGVLTSSTAGDVTSSGTTTTVASVGGSTAANVHTAEVAANAATSANTASTIVARDGSGNFTAGTVTASLSGNVTAPAGTAAAPSINFTGSTTTGLSAQTANNLAFSVSGSEKMRLASSGLSIATTTVSYPLTVANPSNADNLLVLADGGTTKWSLTAEAGTGTNARWFGFLNVGNNPAFLYSQNSGFFGFSPTNANPHWGFHYLGSSTGTTTTGLTKDNVSTLYPLIVSGNTNATLNNWEGFGFAGSSNDLQAEILAVNEAQTAGTEASHLSFFTANGTGTTNSTLVEGLRINKDQTVQLPHYTTVGVVSNDTSGNISSIAPSTSRNVLMSNGSAWASTAFTAPTVQVFTSGSGTYTKPTGVLYLHVRMVGGGGGGGGSGDSVATTGGTGGNSTFGTTLLVANGAAAAAGGTASLGTGPIGLSTTGGSGTGTTAYASSIGHATGSPGAASPFGGAGGGGGATVAGSAGVANTGSGGGGGGANSSGGNGVGGAGGGAGGFVDAVITSPSASYSYSVGAGGTAGTAGTNGVAGGAGGSGIIIVEEHYQ